MGMIFDIQRCSYHDGPGIRTTVFFKGCGLRCAWCHNPESFSAAPQLRFLRHLCTNCGACQASCLRGVHQVTAQTHMVEFQRCAACGTCVEHCPTGALSILGYEATVEDIMAVVRRDKPFYQTSGGGLTVSGGEPTAQGAFLQALLEAARAEGIHTCLETNGYIPVHTLEAILPLTDLFLLDYKLSEEEGLEPYTHASGPLWAHTLETLASRNKPVVLRMPVISGINDTPRHFERAARLRRQYPNIQALEIMPYHAIGAPKWEQLGMTYTMPDLPTVTKEQADQWRSQLQAIENALAAEDPPRL